MKQPSLLQQILGEHINSSNIHGDILIGNISFEPPFKPVNEHIVDSNDQILCKCTNAKVAKGLTDLLWDLV